MVGTGSATRCPKPARNRAAMATGATWRVACEAALAWRWTGCSCAGSVVLPDTDEALEEVADDMVTGSTRGMAMARCEAERAWMGLFRRELRNSRVVLKTTRVASSDEVMELGSRIGCWVCLSQHAVVA